MTSPRRLSSVLVALATIATFGPLAASPASAADGPAVRFDDVSATSESTPDGTAVTTSFRARNVSGHRTTARTAYVSLVAVDHDPGPQFAYRLRSVRIPALAPGHSVSVAMEAVAPRATVERRYHVRVCTTPRAGAGTCTLSPRPSVRVGPADLVLDQSDIGFDDTAPGAESPAVDVVVTNAGQSRTNRIRLAVTGGDHPGDFSVDPGTCTTWLAPGESCTAAATFGPPADAAGIRNSWLLVGGHGRGGQVAASLVGTVVPASGLTIEPATHDYGQVPVGNPASFTFDLVNHTDADDTLIDGNLSSYDAFGFDYAEGQNSCLDFVIPANGSCTFSVAFLPPGPGDFSAVVTFSGQLGTATSELSGTGIEPVLAPARPHRIRNHSYLR